MKGRRYLAAGVVALTVVVACTFSKQLGTTDAGPCATAPSATCADDATLQQCTTVGAPPTTIACAWGCKADHCGVVAPAGGGVTTDDTQPDGLATLGDIVIESAATIDGTAGTITGIAGGFSATPRGGIVVFRMKSLTVNAPVKLAGSAAIAIVTDGPIVVNARIDVKGTCGPNDAAIQPGPGGFAGAAGSSASAAGSGGGGGALLATGAGGGGNGTTGGSGGTVAARAVGSGGAIIGTATIEVLVGGGGGGASDGGGGRARGGGGGGAIQLVSNTRISLASGGIDAGGCPGDSAAGNGDDGGGGGGAGGTILLEAPVIEGDGKLAVNGGGGGAGHDETAQTGSQSTLSRLPALGGTLGANGAAGGAGAAGSSAALPGFDATNHAGGGGGGIGRIRFNTRDGSVTATGEMSPSLQDPSSTCTAGPANVQ